MKKYFQIILLLCLCLLLNGCAQEAAETIPETTEAVILREPDILEGEWIAGGIVSNGTVVSFKQNDALADLYDTNWVYINPDGSYELQNGRYTYFGTWQPLELEDHEHFYMLSQSGYSAITDTEQTESVKTYFAAYLDEAYNVLLVYENLEDGESPLIYNRDGNSRHLQTLMNGGTVYSGNESEKAPERAPAREQVTVTSGMKNALRSAENYLEFMPFSRTGLIEQLEYEGYTNSEATYAVDNCGADWYEQAVRSAENYLEFMAFSRTGLIEQLEYEGYTHDQAVYGVDKVY